MQWPWKKAETDLEREMRYHLETLADRFERQGMSRAEATRRARGEFGGLEQVKEQCRDESRWRPLSHLGQDLRFGIRMLRKTPVVTAAAVLSLALGIGATTAILSLVDAVLWRTLPVPQPQQLSEIFWRAKAEPDGLFGNASGSMFRMPPGQAADFFSAPAFEAMRASAAGRAEILAHMTANDVSTSYAGSTAVVRLRPVSGNFFSTLGVLPFAGRLLSESDNQAAAPSTAVVSHQYWESTIKGDREAVGRLLRVNNRPYVIVGVLPANFGGIGVGEAVDVYTPIQHCPDMFKPDAWLSRDARNPRTWYLQLFMRRAPGVTSEAIQTALDPVFRSTFEGKPKNPAGMPYLFMADGSRGLGALRREFGNPVSILLTLVALVLLIACANIANLLLARADARRKEVALRVSLGCGRARLIRQFMTESALLAGLGGLLSLGIAYLTANFAVELVPYENGPVRLPFELDIRALLFTAAVTVFTVLVFGLYPAWRATRVDAAPALKEGAGSVGTSGRSWWTPGRLLILAQMALGVLLVAVAANFTAHLNKLANGETGFERSRLLLFDLKPGQSGYEGPRLRQFYFELEEKLKSLPGVEAVGLAQIRPMTGGGNWDQIKVDGNTKGIHTAVNYITADFLSALGVRIVAGRGFTAEEVRAGANVAVVSEELAKEIGGASQLGVRFKHDGKLHEVIGVARKARYSDMANEVNVLYRPHLLTNDSLTALLRTSAPPMQVLDTVRKAVCELNPDLPIVDAITMEMQISKTLKRERLFAWLCGGFGTLALLLCMVGLYGVMSYATTRRRQEIGIRMALGAARGDVLRRVLREGMAMAGLGLLIGAPAAYWIALKYIDYREFGMDPLNPATVAWAVAALAASALLAVLMPALRASSDDPVQALRQG